MLTEPSKGALWGNLSVSAKTMAMGTAGVALWGSLAFYLAVGGEPPLPDAPTEAAERLFLRMELPETALLNGCVENFGGTSCGDNAWVIISEDRARAMDASMPRKLADNLPAPLWAELVARHSMSDEKCRTTIEDELPDWLTSGARARTGLHATLVPDRFTTCQGISSNIDPVRDVQAFWIMNDEKVVAEVRCTMPVGGRESECQFSAYPDHGNYVVTYSRLPATNVSDIVDQSAHMLNILATNLPESMAGRVDLAFLEGDIALDEASAHAVASLHEMVR